MIINNNNLLPLIFLLYYHLFAQFSIILACSFLSSLAPPPSISVLSSFPLPLLAAADECHIFVSPRCPCYLAFHLPSTPRCISISPCFPYCSLSMLASFSLSSLATASFARVPLVAFHLPSSPRAPLPTTVFQLPPLPAIIFSLPSLPTAKLPPQCLSLSLSSPYHRSLPLVPVTELLPHFSFSPSSLTPPCHQASPLPHFPPFC